jgi:hypothetical protein
LTQNQAFPERAPNILPRGLEIHLTGTHHGRTLYANNVPSFRDSYTPRGRIYSQAMPRQGASSGFKYGRAVGAIEAVIALCGIPLTIIEPTAWKKFHGLRGSDKEANRQRALQLFPAGHSMLARKKDHGRAEAALIASVPIQGTRAS